MWPFSRKGASGFSWYSTAEEVTRGIDGTGLTAIVTGASSGIGIETTRVLALRDVHVIMAVRNVSCGNQVKETIIKELPGAKIDVMEVDLSSFASIRKFALEFNSRNLPLNILINNAGIMASPFLLSHDGIELQFATNYLELLLENMKQTSYKSNKEGRIVMVSSEAHRFPYKEGIHFDKINDQSMYSSVNAYGQSKLANILHANMLSRQLKVNNGNYRERLGDFVFCQLLGLQLNNWLWMKPYAQEKMEEGVQLTANSLHPGSISTNLLRYHSIIDFFARTAGKLLLKNVPQGAATSCYVALHPQVKGISGEYFSDSNVATPSSKSVDIELAKKLWDFSLKMVS